jgi:YidC/Oxa1 family membrane protein insertase
VFAAAHVCGGSLGAGVIAVSAIVRLALLPVTLRAARHARDQQARLAALKPALESLQRRYAKDPVRLMRETQALHAANGIRFLHPTNVRALLVQAPLLGGLFAAVRGGLGSRVRFLWIADLAQRNSLLVGIVAVMTGIVLAIPSSSSGSTAPNTAFAVSLSVAVSLFFLWSASSAVLLSVGTGSLISALQAWLLSRESASQS